MILDQLIEKKDLLAYIEYRSNRLVKSVDRVVKRLPPKKRDKARRRLLARAEELDHLRKVINRGSLKVESKGHYYALKHMEEGEHGDRMG